MPCSSIIPSPYFPSDSLLDGKIGPGDIEGSIRPLTSITSKSTWLQSAKCTRLCNRSCRATWLLICIKSAQSPSQLTWLYLRWAYMFSSALIPSKLGDAHWLAPHHFVQQKSMTWTPNVTRHYFPAVRYVKTGSARTYHALFLYMLVSYFLVAWIR